MRQHSQSNCDAVLRHQLEIILGSTKTKSKNAGFILTKEKHFGDNWDANNSVADNPAYKTMSGNSVFENPRDLDI